MAQPRLVLASSSPRRSEILSRLALDFEIRPADVDEGTHDGESPVGYATRVATDKASAIATAHTVTIAADTIVVLDDQILGKPIDATRAAEILTMLSGRCHQVITAVVVTLSPIEGPSTTVAGTETTQVEFANLSADRIRWYASLDEPLDKAGAYGLQGAGSLFADKIVGSPTNVIGLPIQLLDRLFSDLGLDLLSFHSRGAQANPS